MKKRVVRFFAGIALSAILLVNSLGFASLIDSPAVAYAAEQVEQADQIHYTLTGPDSVTFSWHKGSDTIRYGETVAYGRTVAAGKPDITPISDSGPWREAKLTGLQPGKTYHYSIGSGEDHTFHTAPAAGSSGFTIVTTGDIGSSFNYDSASGMNKLIKDLNPDLYIGLGDFTYANAHGQEAVTHYFNDVMPWSTEVPFMPIWGNHEWETPQKDDLRNYKGRFGLPNARTVPTAPSLGCCGNDWYFFDYGNTRFIGMPEPFSSSTWSNWAEHAQPIFEQAQSDSNITFIVTFVHRPTWSSGYYDSDTNLQNTLREMGAKFPKYVLNLNGHDHHYERSNPKVTDDIVTIIAGGGGAGLHIYEPSGCKWKMCEQPNWSAARYFNYGAVKLKFEENQIKGEFVCGPLEGRGRDDVNCKIGDVLDVFTIQPRTVAGNTNAPPDLSDLKVDGTTVSGFNTDKTTYTMNVRNFMESVKVTAELQASADAVIQVVGGDKLIVGNNTVTVTVTPKNGMAKVYTITVIREDAVAPGVEMSGSGTAADPYIVMTPQHLDKIRNKLSAYYRLGADIDLAGFNPGDGKGWMPIGSGSSTKFTGSLDGSGYKIHNLLIDRGDTNYVGLFGYAEKAVFKNVWLENVNITGLRFVGALAGLMNANPGGAIDRSYATGMVKGTSTTSGSAETGGLVGDLQHSTITNSYSKVDVTGGFDNSTGGLAGRTSSSAANGRITYSYAAGVLSTGGGFLGAASSSSTATTVQSSYWDTEKTTRSSSPKGGEGKTTNDMKKKATYVGWDFNNVWDIQEDADYPQLRNVRQLAPSNAELADLKVNGTTVAGFSPSTEQYTVNVLNDVKVASVTATLKADPNSKVEVSGGSSLNTGANTVTVKVTAKDNSLKTYTITVNRDATVKSSFKDLNDFKVNGTTINGFKASQWYYSMNVPYQTSQLTVEASTAADSKAVAAVSVIGGSKLTGSTVSDLQIADNTIKVTVTAEDGTKKIYLLIVTRGKYVPTAEEKMDGEGTEEIPYIVKTPTHLNFMRNNIDAMYKLGADIDLTGFSAPDGKGWLPIGISSPESFKGSFDGNGYKIIGMTINRPDLDYVGLFGYATSATFKNIQMIDVNVTGKNNTGGFVGYTGGNGTTDKSYVTGKVTGNNYVGGFSGASQRSPVSNSYANVEVTGNQNVGGLTGNLDNSGGTFGKITNSYSVGKVTGITNFGGLIGAVLGGPNPNYKVTSSYWDTQTSNQPGSVYGTPITTANMKQKATFVDWDFVNVWEIDEGKDYPRLKVKNQQLSSNADLKELKVDNTAVSGFSANNLNYTVNVPNSKTVVSVTYATYDPNASVAVTGGSSLIVGDNTVKVTVTAQDNTTKVYTITVNRVAAALSSNADLSDLKVDNTAVSGFSANNLNYTVNVPNSKTVVSVTYATYDPNASVAVIGGSNLIIGDNTVTVTVTAQDVTTKKIYTITVNRAAAIKSRGNSGSPQADTGTSTGTSTVSGQPTTGEGAVKLEAVVSGNTAKGEISAQQIKGNDIVVTSKIASFTLPKGAIDTTALEQQLGSDWKLVIRMEVLSEEQRQIIGQRINAVGGSIIGNVIDFTVTAEANGRSVTITQFNGLYSTRNITMDTPADSKQTTVVRIEEDGSLTFVPAIFNGREVTFYSPSNSKYAVVSVNRNFQDTQGHWAMKEINVLASKLIVSGTDEEHYSPERPITRAEFVTLIVRSLGYQAVSGSAQFKDVKPSEWYAGYVQKAVDLGIISGHGDGTFHPQDEITREQMAIVLNKALSLAGKPLSKADMNGTLGVFSDQKQVSGWAAQEVATAVNAGLLTGMPNGQFQPQSALTRAQAAAVIMRLLQKANFVN
ncbi:MULTISPECIES: cadherin-like beta sandwich domain-containing protein [unclassified Paenibacillus]|uniref:cadherin-like beta sandwich domain-containing protein n=1 Tax=unclassified Paenibacillus TaxID=185978 RepID=UPI00362D30F1